MESLLGPAAHALLIAFLLSVMIRSDSKSRSGNAVRPYVINAL